VHLAFLNDASLCILQLSQQDGIDLEVKQLDVTNLDRINQVVTDIINTEGRIDNLVV
jgi:NAD(P)-dependent dehydrogenase (short-subunit alcohol dehydrogenase family)